ncbi:extracellular matrix protein 2 [Salminus brasiliensis]|uniref:extracellular matrix protein 2 n=1 Tax=Salminus brasiliensis TaxID=930266 RepID=UPI003B83A338
MRAVILLFWIFAWAADTLVLQPSLNVSVLQNGSVEVEFWTDWSQPSLPSAVQEKEPKWTDEPGTQVNVTIMEEEEADTLHSNSTEGEEHRTFKKGDRKVTTEEQSHQEKVSHVEVQETRTRKTNSDAERHPHVEKDNEYPSETTPTVHQILNQPNTAETPLPSQYVNSTVRPILSTVVQSPPAIIQISRGKKEETTSLPVTEAGHLLVTNVSTLLTKGTSTNANSSVAKNENGNSRLHPAKKEEFASPAMAAKADEVTTAPYFPYFKDHYCPPDCACYGRVVQCSDKELDKIPYGIPYNSRYILLMNNHIGSIPLDLLSEYLSVEFLVLSNNRLTDSSIEGAFEGIQALKRLYLERNLLQSIPTDLPATLEELRMDGNKVKVMSEAAWSRCPGLLILSLSNNSLGSGSSNIPAGVLSPLGSLRTLSLSYNQLTSVPLHLPVSLQELYLRGNLIQRFKGGAFQEKAELQVLDLSANRLTNKGLGKAALINATRLESLNLEGNFLKHVPRHLPRSLKTLNLEGNSISSVSKTAFFSLPHLEHLGLARNKISKVEPGAFWMLQLLHQLDLSHNALRQVPRQLPTWLVSISLTHNKIQTIPRDAFCWARHGKTPISRLVRVQLENNLVDLGSLDSLVFSCLRGFQVVHFY